MNFLSPNKAVLTLIEHFSSLSFNILKFFNNSLSIWDTASVWYSSLVSNLLNNFIISKLLSSNSGLN